jgi:hypothetical protein
MTEKVGVNQAYRSVPPTCKPKPYSLAGDRCPRCGREDWRDLDSPPGELFCRWCNCLVEEDHD